jgi:hypothetical protein
MPFNPEIHSELPELRKSKNPAENRNHDYLAQAKLMGRDPAGEMEWVERYAARFRELFTKDDGFRELVNGDLDDETLTKIQARLDEKD